MIARIVGWANGRADVQAVVLLGSQARTEHKADQWSDIDVVLLVDDPDRYLSSEAWLEHLGSPLLTLVQAAALGGGLERRVLFRSGMDVDFALVPAALAHDLVAVSDDPQVRTVLGRGIKVLVDKTGFIRAALDGLPHSGAAADVPSQAELDQISKDFWYHVILAAKKLRRGEVWVAKAECDSHLKRLVVELMAWRARLEGPAVDAWHEGRFLEEWADDRSLHELRDAYARYDADDVARALRATADMFEHLELACAHRLASPLRSRTASFAGSWNRSSERSVGICDRASGLAGRHSGAWLEKEGVHGGPPVVPEVIGASTAGSSSRPPRRASLHPFSRCQGASVGVTSAGLRGRMRCRGCAHASANPRFSGLGARGDTGCQDRRRDFRPCRGWRA